jgi:hypothetical protein
MAPGPTPRFDRALQCVLVTAFLVLLTLPLLGMVLQLEAPSLNEKRRLAPRPPLSLVFHSASRFVTELGSYLSDNFGFRSTLVRWNSHLIARSLAVSPSPRVVLGREGWLYYAGEHIIDDYRCLKPFTDEELRAWSEALVRRQEWLERRGIRYLFSVAPNEHTIYPEYLPSHVTRIRDTSRLDQLLAHLKAHTTLPVIDLRPALMAAKVKERVYRKTDTHWNERGAFAAYQEILQPIHAWFPAVRAWPRDRFENTVAKGPGGDLAEMLGMTDVYQEEVLGLRPLDARRASFLDWPTERFAELHARPQLVRESFVPDPALPRLVMFHDSFGLALQPFLAEHFSKATYVFNPMSFEDSILGREKPGLVIQEITERYLWVDYPGIYEHVP